MILLTFYKFSFRYIHWMLIIRLVKDTQEVKQKHQRSTEMWQNASKLVLKKKQVK